MDRRQENHRFSSSKGQQEVLSIVLISGILIGVVGSVYFWGVPLIQKNKDVAVLENSEDFMNSLNTRIKFIANNGGRDQLVINVPGTLRFDPIAGTIELTVLTEGTIYAKDAEIPLGRNSQCSASQGAFGIDEPETLCVKSAQIGEKNFRTTYTLKYVKLVNNNILRDFQIELTGNANSGGEQNFVAFENLGTTQSASNGRALIKTLVAINVV